MTYQPAVVTGVPKGGKNGYPFVGRPGNTEVQTGLDAGAKVEASPIGRAALDQISVQRAAVLSVLELTRRPGGGGTPGGSGAPMSPRDEALLRAVTRLASRPFGESTAGLVDAAPTWAAKEGKQVQMDVEGREVRVPPALAKVLGGALTHLVRNAVAHGIEPPARREALGKPPIGIIHTLAVAGARGPTITVEDDGQGLDLQRIADRASELGLAPIAGNVAELVFASGVTTAASGNTLAGRGVGLSAVRADLEPVGYMVEIESERGRFTRVVLKPRSNAATSSSRASSTSGTAR